MNILFSLIVAHRARRAYTCALTFMKRKEALRRTIQMSTESIYRREEKPFDDLT
jgi:hypothetical protein